MPRRGPSSRPAHLQVVFPVHDEPVAEHVPHHDEVGVLALHAHAVHAKELREERAAVTLHDVLQGKKERERGKKKTRTNPGTTTARLVSYYTLELLSKQAHVNRFTARTSDRMPCSLFG